MKLELFYSLKPWIVTQDFYGDRVCANPNNPKDFKVKVGDSCDAGMVSLYSIFGYKTHGGNDVVGALGQTIRASINGYVKYIETERERGLGVEIVSEDRFDFKKEPDKGIPEDITCRVRTGDYHMNAVRVVLGQQVKTGDVIGEVGSTGFSTAPHDHFFVKLCDDNGESLYPNNGWRSCIDPAPYFSGYFAEDAQRVILIRRLIDLYSQLVAFIKGRQ